LTDPFNLQPERPTAQAALPTAAQAPTTLSSQDPASTAPLTATSSLLRPTETDSIPGELSEETTGDITPVPLTLDVTLPVTETRTSTPVPEATPIYALIRAREGGGAYIRKEPGGNVIATLDNDSIVQVLSDAQDYNGVLWIQIAATRNDIRVEGWIIQSVLETATPVPNWEPSETPTPTP